jgi:pyruvate dehydrogenase (quinone)
MVFLGNPEYACDLAPINFAEFTGFTIENPEKCAAPMNRVFATPGPVVIEALVDPNEPPMPAKVTERQAAHLAEALAKGTSDGHRIIKTILADMVRELV